MAPCCNNNRYTQNDKIRPSIGRRQDTDGRRYHGFGEAAAEQNNAAMANASKDPASIPASASCSGRHQIGSIRSRRIFESCLRRIYAGCQSSARSKPGQEYIAAAAIPEGYSGIVGIPGGIVNNRPSDTQNSTDQLNSSNHWYQA